MKHVFCAGNLLDSKAQVLINTVNCEGVMGKGLALQFKEAYPQMFFSYKEFCAKGNMSPGNFHAWKIPNTNPQRYIVNLPTKIKWRNPSQYEWIEKALSSFEHWCWLHQIKDVAMPPLGCGNGGLDKKIVTKMILGSFVTNNDIELKLYGF